MPLRTQTARKCDPSKLEQSSNATATQFDPSDFFVRRPQEYEGTLIVLTTPRIKESYAQEIYLNTYRLFTPDTLHLERAHKMSLPGIAEESERYMEWFAEESATQPIVKFI